MDAARVEQDAFGERGLACVDVGNDADVSELSGNRVYGESLGMPGAKRCPQADSPDGLATNMSGNAGAQARAVHARRSGIVAISLS
jgi:hypothetical protein